MKHIFKSVSDLLALGALLLCSPVSVRAQVSAQASDPKSAYVISVPPGWKQDHKTVRDEMLKWMAQRDEFKNKDGSAFDPTKNSPFDESQGFYIPRAGGNLFTAHISETQAKALDSDFKIDGKKLIVHESHNFEPCPITIDNPGADSDIYDKDHVHILTTTTWGADAVVTSSFSRPQMRTPVLYVVDTGVQPIVPTATGATTYKWNPQFSAASGGTPKLSFLQGRLAPSLGRSWQFVHPTPGTFAPDPDAPVTTTNGNSLPAPWNAEADDTLVWTGTGVILAPCPKSYDTGVFLDPQRDENPPSGTPPHGTPITSCAVGTNVGVLGKITGLSYAVESIRVYNGVKTPTATIVEGIYRAIDAHKKRVANVSTSVSVLLLASRSTPPDNNPTGPAFDQSLEVALWWAWYSGMVCVVSAGNESGAYDTTSTPNKFPPDSQWFPPNTSPKLTSPSRFDWSVGATANGKATWDSLAIKTELGETVEVPDKAYLIMVGASNTTNAAPTNDNWAPSASVGPDVDIIAPSLVLPCAKNTYSTLYANGDSLMTASGGSFSTGYVAGAALAYLASVPQASANPTEFRKWLLPDATIPTGANAYPITLSTTAQSKPDTALSAKYNGKMPMLKIKSSTVWP